jgi:hypothetical protein
MTRTGRARFGSQICAHHLQNLNDRPAKSGRTPQHIANEGALSNTATVLESFSVEENIAGNSATLVAGKQYISKR